MKKLLSLLTLLILSGFFSSIEVLAQADISMTSHWYNRSAYNPASIARPDYIYFFANARQQWAGVTGAPHTYNIQASGYNEQMQSAFGFSMVSDQIGATQNINTIASYAHLIPVNNNWNLSMGLSGGLFVRSYNGSLYEADVINDDAIDYSQTNQTRPDANVGFEFQSNSFIVSLSSTHLFAIGKADDLYLFTNHRYGSIIYKNTKSLLYNYHVGLQVINRLNLTVVEGNACIRFKHQTGLMRGPQEVCEVGITYRSSQQFTLLGGITLSPTIRVGYAYNQSFMKGYSATGTHEIMIEYRFRLPSSFLHKNRFDGFWYN